MSDIRLSVITPCYNAASTIENTLKSVEAQHYDAMEHIIIDGASNDDTLLLVREYSERVPYEVKIVSEADNGIYDAMNKGINMASGELIGIVNADDWYEPQAFEKIISAYSGRDKEIIYGMIRLYDKDKLKSIEFYHHDFLLERMINHPGCFVSSKVYKEVGLFDTSYRSSADYDWMKRASDNNCVFTPVYEVLANVRCGGMSSTNVGFRETLKLQYKWGLVSRTHYVLYDLKSRLGDLARSMKPRRDR